MKRTSENVPSPIDTVPRAAAELIRLHRSLGAQAVELTRAYIAERLTGDEGITWRRGTHLISERVAILDPVTRIGHDIELGAYFLPFNERARRFRLTNTGSTTDDSLTVERQGNGFNPGEKYWVVGDDVLSARRTAHHAYIPWEEGFTGTIHTLDTSQFAPIDPEDKTAFTRLTRTIMDISTYEVPTPEESTSE